MVGRSVLLGLCVAAGLGLAAQAKASSLSFDAIKLWAGNGPDKAAMVIDWNGGISPQSLEWGFRWDPAAGPVTGETMFNAIVAADPHLFSIVYTDPTYGDSIFGLGYTFTNQSFSYVPGADWDANEDGKAGIAGDHYQEGFWVNGYWNYYTQDAADTSWQYATAGMGGRTLSDGSWDGWTFGPAANSWFGPAPSDPVAVPEPASVAMLAAGAAGLMLRRRRGVTSR